MRDTEVLDSAILREVVHRDEVVTVRRQWHHLPPEDDQPHFAARRAQDALLSPSASSVPHCGRGDKALVSQLSCKVESKNTK